MPLATDPLDTLFAVTALGSSTYRAAFPEGWLQGRGLFGGLVAATLVRAMELEAPGRALRSLSAQLPAPVAPGEATIVVETLRTGSAVSTLAARLVQQGQVLAHGVGVLGQPRPLVPSRVFMAPGERPDPDSLDVIPVGPPFGPQFAPNFEYRSDQLPFSGAREPRTRGWVRPRRPGVDRGPAFLAACIDAFWPAEFMLLDAPRPMATIAFTFQPVGTLDGLDPDAPLFYRAEVPVTAEGYAVELRELWGRDGRLLALNQQTFCTIK